MDDAAITNTDAANQELELSGQISLVRCLTGNSDGRQQGALFTRSKAK
jgi:hypothetical protein